MDTVDEVIAEDRVAEAEVPVSSTLETTVKGTTKVANAIISKVQRKINIYQEHRNLLEGRKNPKNC